MNDETTLLKLLFSGSLTVIARFAIRICELEDTIDELTRYLKKEESHEKIS